MIKIDQNYTDYRDDSDPKYPGGKAVNATTSEGTDGTPLLADWMNDVNGALQAIFIEAFDDINKVSGKPDNVQESDVLKSIKEIIKKSLPNSASQGDLSDANSTQGTGLVKTANRSPNEKECQQNEPWAASPNWVYNLLTGNAAGDVNTAVTGALKDRLVSWTASQGDYADERPAQGVGLVKTVNRGPNAQECQKNEPWAASPNWVYNLLTGKAADEVNEAVTGALKDRLVSWTASQGDYADERPATFAITYENEEPPAISGYRWELASKGSSVYPVRPVGNVGSGAVYCYWSLKAI